MEQNAARTWSPRQVGHAERSGFAMETWRAARLELAFVSPVLAPLRAGPRQASVRRPRLYACAAAPSWTSHTVRELRRYLREEGRAVPLDHSNRLERTSCDAGPLEAPWVDVVSSIQRQVVECCASCDDGKVLSVYIRGSVVSGFARPGVSDLDVIVYARGTCVNRLIARRPTICREVLQSFANVVQKIDLSVYRIDSLEDVSHAEQVPCGVMLQAFGRCVWGTDFLAECPAGIVKPILARNVNNDAASAIASSKARLAAGDNLGAWRDVQWLVKRELRAGAEVAAAVSGAYARDLFPCYTICSEAFPAWRELLEKALLIACAPGEELGDARCAELLPDAWECSGSLAAVVEDVFLRREFAGFDADQAARAKVPIAVRPTQGEDRDNSSIWGRLGNPGRAIVSLLRRDGQKEQRKPLVRDTLPRCAVFPATLVREREIDPLGRGEAGVTEVLKLRDEPAVFRQAAEHYACSATLKSYRFSPSCLAVSDKVVDVRVSRSNVFVFCRGQHEWIRRGEFVPPSVALRMSEREFLQRCLRSNERGADANRSLLGGDYELERVYMQTRIAQNVAILEPAARRHAGLTVLQEERVWVSTEGSVSSLHYDASMSALIQVVGKKRMVFFPPEAIPLIGIYPAGHPLHRRARVDLSRACAANEVLFSEFWKRADSFAQEVVLEPGDVCVFPQAWAHYTESLTFSVSHTFRWAA